MNEKPLKSFSYTFEEFHSKSKLPIAIILIFTAVALIRVSFTDWAYKQELILGILGLIVLLFITAFLVRLYRNTTDYSISYTFFDDRIEFKKGKKLKRYQMDQFESIDRSSNDGKYMQFDATTLFFENGKRLVINSNQPIYSAVDNYLKTYLKDRLQN
jgi:hypothetical protein